MPLYSYVPDGFLGANESLKDAVRRRQRQARADKAKEVLDRRRRDHPGRPEPAVQPDHYGQSSGDEYAMIKDQLEKSGLFKVNLQSTEWVHVLARTARADDYPAVPARLVPGLLATPTTT